MSNVAYTDIVLRPLYGVIEEFRLTRLVLSSNSLFRLLKVFVYLRNDIVNILVVPFLFLFQLLFLLSNPSLELKLFLLASRAQVTLIA